MTGRVFVRVYIDLILSPFLFFAFLFISFSLSNLCTLHVPALFFSPTFPLAFVSMDDENDSDVFGSVFAGIF